MSGHASHWDTIQRELKHLNAQEKLRLVDTIERDIRSTSTVALDAQQLALRELLEITAAIPCSDAGDGLSGRDHDQILYGDLK